MIFDFKDYTEEMETMRTFGGPKEIEEYLLHILSIVDPPLCSDSRTPDDSPKELIDAEAVEWMKNRLDAQITVRNDLATLYRENGDIPGCLSVVRQMTENVIEAELGGTPIHAQMLLHEASVYLEAKQGEKAIAAAQEAEEIFDKCKYDDASLRAGVKNIIAAANKMIEG